MNLAELKGLLISIYTFEKNRLCTFIERKFTCIA